MNFSLKNKTALITGASSGIGEACAEIFAQHGANLIIAARREEKLQQLASKLIEKYKSPITWISLDVTDYQQVVTKLVEIPSVDILINNAGLALGLDPIHSANPEHWNKMIDTNIKGLLWITQQVLPKMLARNHGHIINISSIAARRVYFGGSVYCASKHAVDAITRTLKLEVQGTAIRVSSIEPGMTETEFSLVRFERNNARAQQVYTDTTPLCAEDIAEIILFCVTRPPHVNIAELSVLPTDQKGMD